MSEIHTKLGVFAEEEDLRALERVGLLEVEDGEYHAGDQFETLMPVLRALDGARTVSRRERTHADTAGDDPPPAWTGDTDTRTDAEFVSLVAHDLRGPLSQASGWLALARADGNPEYFDGVEDALERMGKRVEDLVRLASDGADPEAMEAVSLAETAERVWEDVLADAATEGATLVVEGDWMVIVVRDRLERLLANLLRNALVHGREPGESETRANGGQGQTGLSREPNGGELQSFTVRVGRLPGGFYVEDDGVGMAEDERERAFTVGYSTGGDGSGLGLASVAQVAAAHGWSVNLTASDAGGARFEFSGVATPT